MRRTWVRGCCLVAVVSIAATGCTPEESFLGLYLAAFVATVWGALFPGTVPR